MITVSEARAIIAENTRDFGIEEIPLDHSIGRVLRQPVFADRDMPPYDRVTMDGIAINFDCYEKGQRSFDIVGVAAAGAPVQTVDQYDGCIEVMTGAIMPLGVDTVIPYELVTIADDKATVDEITIKQQQNIHFKGLDRKTGDQILSPGLRISSVDVGVCATVGQSTVKVSKLPKTIVISSGDELVGIDEMPLPHQIRKSNVFRLKTVLSHYQMPVDTAHLMDDMDEIVLQLQQCLMTYDLIILSGGVSKGKFDFLPEALEKVNVQKIFHKIAQRPGKPFWFGKHKGGATVFAFPGNPVSSFACVQQYFKPWLDRCIRLNPMPKPMAVLTQEVFFKPDLTYFLEVKIDFSQQGEILATPVKGNGSGDLANLVDADAFIELPQGREVFKVGEVFPIERYRQSDF